MAQHIPNGGTHAQPKKLKVAFGPELAEKITEDDTKVIEFQIANLDDFKESGALEVEVASSHPEIAQVEQAEKYMLLPGSTAFTPNTNWTGSFNLSAKFLGYSKVVVKLWGRVSLSGANKTQMLAESEPAKVSVIRPPRAVDTAFIYTVAILVSVAFINMGCIVDLNVVKATLKKPIGPLIGFCSQYLFMPLVTRRPCSALSSFLQRSVMRFDCHTLYFSVLCSVLLGWLNCCWDTTLPSSLVCSLPDAVLAEVVAISGPTCWVATSISASP